MYAIFRDLPAPNDPYYQFQTNMDIVQATDITDTGSNIIVAVIVPVWQLVKLIPHQHDGWI